MLRVSLVLCALAAAADGLMVGTAQVVGQTGLTAVDEVTANMAIYRNITLEGKAAGARVIVFPEFGLYQDGMGKGAGKNCSMLRSYCDTVPSKVSCAQGRTQADRLSCMAQDAGLYTSINVCEVDEANSLWNTQLVYDPSGELIAKYRKTHPFFKCFESPQEVVTVTVQVDGRTFGVFTCKDIFYSTPGVTLRKMGVDEFLYAAAIEIVGDLAVSTWSRVHNATMVYSDGSSGLSGVYRHGHRLTPKPSPGNRVIVWDI